MSGYSGIIGAFAPSPGRNIPYAKLQLTFISTAVLNITRSYDLERPRARSRGRQVWLGIYLRTADVRGAQMGQQVADWGTDHYFQPVNQPNTDHTTGFAQRCSGAARACHARRLSIALNQCRASQKRPLSIAMRKIRRWRSPLQRRFLTG